MSIQPSADTARLIAELDSPDALRRETAAARLSVIGGRAVTRLLALAGDSNGAVHARLAALGALEAIGDSRSYAIAKSLADGSDVRLAVAAIGILGVLAEGDGTHADKAFDTLTGMALDAAVDSDRRVAACQALEGQPSKTVGAIFDALSSGETAAPVQAHAARAKAGATEPIDSLEPSDLPSDPAVLLAIVREEGADARVTLLRSLIDRVRDKERATRSAGAREQWMAARGLLHQHLAAKNSRLAVYDLRETLEAAATTKSTAPLPVGFLAAAAAVGDAACLEPLASCWMSASDDKWWREHLAEAFAAIVKREKITRKHATIKKILQKWPAAGQLAAAAKS